MWIILIVVIAVIIAAIVSKFYTESLIACLWLCLVSGETTIDNN